MKTVGAFRSFLNSYAERIATPAISGSALTLDLSKANVFIVDRNGNMTSLTIANVPTGRAVSFSLRLKSNGSAYTWTWPGTVAWGNSGAPTLSTASNKRDWFTFVTVDGGSTWDVFTAGQGF